MSNYHCYLCASDDGIQLDIFGVGGKAICEKIESCLSVKIEESNAITTKICHKCAFELDACSKFVAKYKHSRTKGKNNPIKGHCSLCSEPGKVGYIFDCKDGNPANDTLHKIQEIFNDSIFNDKRRTLSICLDCRYNLDVLFDLKCIYQSTPDKLQHLSEKGLQLSELPKTKTRVVKRKTTFIPVPRLNGTEAYDTDSSSVASMTYKRKRGRPRKNSEPVTQASFRTCEQCEFNVENGLDMYRYHRTGITVCKECWLAMDPEKLTHNKRKKLGIAGGEVGTRRCAIILKDVLTNPAKYENIYKVEKDEHGNTTFIVTDDSSDHEEREKTPAKRSRRSHESVASVDASPVKRTRPSKRTASIKSTDLEDEPPVKTRNTGKDPEDDVSPAKMKGKLKIIPEAKASTSTNSRTKNGLAISDTEVFESRTRRTSARQSTDSEKNAKAASDAELTKPPAKKRATRTKFDKNQPPELTAIEPKTAVTTKGRKTAKNSVVSTTETVDRPARRTRAQSLSSQGATSLSKSHGNSASNAKSVSENESPPAKTRKTKTKSLSPKNSATEVEVENPHTCSVCHVEYRNKLIGMKHELSHAKQPEVKLQRVAIPEIIVEEAPAELSLIEEPEEQSHDISSTSENRPGDSKNDETSAPVDSHDKTSIDVITGTNEKEENLEKSKSSTKVVEKTAKVDDKQEIEEEKVEDKTIENIDKTEDKAAENENKDKDNVNEANNEAEGKTVETEGKNEETTQVTKDKNEPKPQVTEDKNENKTDETDDKNLDQTEVTEVKNLDQSDVTEDKNLDQTEVTEEKNVDQTEVTEDKNKDQKEKTENGNKDKIEQMKDENEDETDEREDKNEDKTDEKEYKNEDKTDERKDHTDNEANETDDKIEDKPEVPESTELKNTVDSDNIDEDNIENPLQTDVKDSSITKESDKNNGDEKIEVTKANAVVSEKPESTVSEEVAKEEESTQPIEKLSEQVLNESAETSDNLIGVSVKDDVNSEVNNANGVENDAVALNSHAESEAVDDHSREKSIERDNVSPVTSTSPEKNDETQDVVKDKISLEDDDTAKDLEAETIADTTETSIFTENNATKDNEASESIVNDVLTEVFDLATAEVQKRLENEPSRDEKCTTPVSETLENISREISNSADMPLLEPVVENQSSKIQS